MEFITYINVKCMTTVAQRLGGEKRAYTILNMFLEYRLCGIYHLKINWDKLKMFTINLKVITKIIKQRVIADKQINEIKWNHKKYSVSPKEDRKKKKKGNKEQRGQIENR